MLLNKTEKYRFIPFFQSIHFVFRISLIYLVTVTALHIHCQYRNIDRVSDKVDSHIGLYLNTHCSYSLHNARTDLPWLKKCRLILWNSKITQNTTSWRQIIAKKLKKKKISHPPGYILNWTHRVVLEFSGSCREEAWVTMLPLPLLISGKTIPKPSSFEPQS